MPVTKIRGTTQLNIDGNIGWNSNKITGLADPTGSQDAATKAYVDAAAAGIDWKESVRAASTVNLTLSGAQTIDGVSVVGGNRVLAKNQTTASENGIYVAAAGAWSRAADANADAEVTSGLATFVTEGTANGGQGWILTTPDPIVVGTTALTFTQFTGVGQLLAGNGLTKTGNTVDVVPLNNSITVAADSIAVNFALFVRRETPSGTVNGSNAGFTLATTPRAGSEEVFLNGLLQEPGSGNDYTISGTTITFETAPLTGDRIRVSYITAAS